MAVDVVPYIDTHLHFWDHSVAGLHWPWLEPGFRHRHVVDSHRLDAARYTTAELKAEAEGTGLVGIVHVQATAPMPEPWQETAWLEGLAEETGWPNAIVGDCHLREADAPDVLRRHAEFGRFRGVRDVTIQKDVEPDALAKAFDTAAELGLSVQMRLPPERFDRLEEIAERWPEVTLVLGHAGLPLERTAEDRARWLAAIERLAGSANVVCKISAVAGASDPNWTVDGIRPWILGAIETFGPQRCMFGGNWPIDRLFGTYQGLIGAYREITADLDPATQAALFHGTAERVYAIEVVPT